jgi:hypothetical protein
MDFKTFKQKTLADLPPSLEAGTKLNKITKIEPYTFTYENNVINALRVYADGSVFKTTSKVVMDQLQKFFADFPNETLDNVKVRQRKKYLILETDE